MSPQQTTHKRSVTILFLFLFLPLVVMVSLVSYHLYDFQAESRLNEIRISEASTLRHIEQEVSLKFESAISDLRFLTHHHELHALFAGARGAYDDLTKDLIVFSEQKAIYDQIRYLDLAGNEIIRINYSDGRPYAVPAEQLQNKADRYYVRESLALDTGGIYISPFDLNIESGRIETPHKPMIRFGAPVFASNGMKQGIIILNYLGSNLIEDFRLSSATSYGQSMLLNQDGYWLCSEQPDREWGFMFDRDDLRFNHLFPGAWEIISNNQQGQFKGESGLFSYQAVTPLNNRLDESSSPYSWRAVSLVDNSRLHGLFANLRLNLGMLIFIITSLFAWGSWWLATLITQHQEDIVSLRQNKMRLKEAAEVARLGGWDWDLVAGQMSWSKELYTVFDIEPDALQPTFRNFFSFIPLNDRGIIREVMNGVFEGNGFSIDHRIQLRSGIERIVHNQAEIEYSPAGVPLRLRGTIQDITRRKQIEKELRETSENYQSLLNQFQSLIRAIDDCIIILDDNRRVIWSNKKLPADAGEHCGLHLISGSPCTNCPVIACINSGSMQEQQQHGETGRTFNIRVFPITREESDKTSNVIIIAQDVTERVNIQSQQIRTGQLASLGEMAAGVAHEINNPLNGIINYAQIMRNRYDHEPGLDDLSARIIKEGERIARIVRSMLSFSRNSGEEIAEVSPEQVVSEALYLTRKQLEQSGIKINFKPNDELPKIAIRFNEIQQVLINLISNARHALEKNSPTAQRERQLEITTGFSPGRDNDYIRFAITDNGTGIPEELLPRVLTPFVTTKPAGVGTGLGLSISHEIIKRHNGTFNIDSIDGSHTTVTFDLPAMQQ